MASFSKNDCIQKCYGYILKQVGLAWNLALTNLFFIKNKLKGSWARHNLVSSVRLTLYLCSSNSEALKRIWINTYNSLSWRNLQLIKLEEKSLKREKSGKTLVQTHLYQESKSWNIHKLLFNYHFLLKITAYINLICYV